MCGRAQIWPCCRLMLTHALTVLSTVLVRHSFPAAKKHKLTTCLHSHHMSRWAIFLGPSFSSLLGLWVVWKAQGICWMKLSPPHSHNQQCSFLHRLLQVWEALKALVYHQARCWDWRWDKYSNVNFVVIFWLLDQAWSSLNTFSNYLEVSPCALLRLRSNPSALWDLFWFATVSQANWLNKVDLSSHLITKRECFPTCPFLPQIVSTHGGLCLQGAWCRL